MSGTLVDTYAAAIQHDQADLPEDAYRIGVVRRAMPWLAAVVDENRPELGPPDPLLDAVNERKEALQAEGLEEATAHNRAMDAVEYDDRYLRYLETADEAQAAIKDLRDRLRQGESIALVCYENTAEKRCHRTLLRSRIEADL